MPPPAPLATRNSPNRCPLGDLVARGIRLSDDGPARSLGTFAGLSRPGSLPNPFVMQWCTGNATQGLYYAWEGIVRETGDTAKGGSAQVNSGYVYRLYAVARVKLLPQAKGGTFGVGVYDYVQRVAVLGWWQWMIYQGWDEPQETRGDFPALRKLFEFVKEAVPDLPREITTAPNPKLYGAIDIWCPLDVFFNLEQVKERQAAGEQAWWYVIGNRFNHSLPLMDARMVFWTT